MKRVTINKILVEDIKTTITIKKLKDFLIKTVQLTSQIFLQKKLTCTHMT